MGLLSRTAYGFIFIALGYIIYQYRIPLLKGKWLWLLVLFSVYAIWFKWKYFLNLQGIDVRTMILPKRFALKSFFIVISGFSLIFLISRLVEKVMVLKRIFVWFGEKSFHFMALNLMGLWIFWWFDRMFDFKVTECFSPRIIGVMSFSFNLIFSVAVILIWDFISNRLRKLIEDKRIFI